MKEELQPIEENKIRMFVCGPTVYDYIHIGNARTFVAFDIIGRYLEYKGFELNYVQNITDIDDKIIQRAKDEGKKPADIAAHFQKAFLEDMTALKISAVNHYALASEHIEEIKDQIARLIEKGYAYAAPTVRAAGADAVDPGENHDVYFDLKKYQADFPNQYGQLSRQTAAGLETGVRVEMEANKRDPRDFVLWKAQNYTFDPAWESPWGMGRPGWHIEDTAISEKYLGQQYDIHGGGLDLIFPHHEAEIAQQQAASGKVPFVKYWLHTGFLVIKDEKMSKSLGNFSMLREVMAGLSKHKAETLRLYFLSAHYHSPLTFESKLIEQSEAAVDRIADFLARLEKASGDENPIADEKLKESADKFYASMDDDFNAPAAIAAIFELIRGLNQLLLKNHISANQATALKTFFGTIERILGIVPEPQEQKIPAEILELVDQREVFRKDKKYQEADTIRTQIETRGYRLDDTAFGPIVSQK